MYKVLNRFVQPEKNKNKINAFFKYLLSCAYDSADNIKIIKESFLNFHIDSFFSEWLRTLLFNRQNESLLVRSINLIKLFPFLADSEYLCREFLMMINSADLCVNGYDRAVENIFSSLMEAVSCFIEFPVNETEYNETIQIIEKEARAKLEIILKFF